MKITNIILVQMTNLIVCEQIRANVIETLREETSEYFDFALEKYNRSTAETRSRFQLILKREPALENINKLLKDKYKGRIVMVEKTIGSEVRRRFHIYFLGEYLRRLYGRKGPSDPEQVETNTIEEVVDQAETVRDFKKKYEGYFTSGSGKKIEPYFYVSKDDISLRQQHAEIPKEVLKPQRVKEYFPYMEMLHESQQNSVINTGFDVPYLFRLQLCFLPVRVEIVRKIAKIVNTNNQFEYTELIACLMGEYEISLEKKYVIKIFPVKDEMKMIDAYNFVSSRKGLFLGMTGLSLLEPDCDKYFTGKGKIVSFNVEFLSDRNGKARIPAKKSKLENSEYYCFLSDLLVPGDAVVYAIEI